MGKIAYQAGGRTIRFYAEAHEDGTFTPVVEPGGEVALEAAGLWSPQNRRLPLPKGKGR